MANRQQDSTADQLRAIYAPTAAPKKKEKAPSALGLDELDRVYDEGRRSALETRPRPDQNVTDLQDFGTNLNIGTRQIPGIVAGLADIPAGLAGFDRPFSKLGSAVGEAIGVDNKSAIERLRGELSPATQRSQRAVAEAKGFLPSLGAYLDNPRAIVADVTASIPATVAGGGLGGAVAKTAGSVAARQAAAGGTSRVASALARRPVAAGIGEGAVAAGAQMADINEDIDPRRAAVASVGTGLATALIAGGGAQLAQKLNIGDPDLIFVGDRPTLAPGVKKRNILSRIGMGAVSEGVFQEMPQGSFEQLAANWAEDKPLLEGVSEAAVASLMSGMGMGGAAGAINIGGPREFIEPTPESGDPTTPDSGAPGTGGSTPRGREQVTDKKLVGGIVQMSQLLDEATTDEQRKIITQHLREAQVELRSRGIDKSIVDEAESESNFAKISERIEKNMAMAKGLAAKDVDRANTLRQGIDEDIQRLVQIERIYPGSRAKFMDNTFSGKFDEMERLAERVRKNRSPKSRASKKSKQANAEALEAAQLELEVMLENNPELADRFEASRPAPEEQPFNPLDSVGEQIGVTQTPQIPLVPEGQLLTDQEVAEEAAAPDVQGPPTRQQVAQTRQEADNLATKAETKSKAAATRAEKAEKAAAAPKLKGKPKTAAKRKATNARKAADKAQAEAEKLRAEASGLLTGQAVGDQPTAETTGQAVGETQTPKVATTKSQKAEAKRTGEEAKRRKSTNANVVGDEIVGADTDDAQSVNASTAKKRLDQLMKATQSTAGLSPEPSTLPQRVPDERPAAVRAYNERITDPSERRIYIKKNGQLTKRGQEDLDKFESMDVPTLIGIAEENAARAKQTPLIRAQQELIQDILETSKAAEMDAFIEETGRQRVENEPLTADEMSNVIIEAQNTGIKKNDLTDRQLKLFEMYNDFSVNEGRDNPITHMRLQLYKEGNAQGGKLPNEKTLREAVYKAADKVIKALMVRRGLKTRREAELLLGPMFHGLKRPTDPNTGFRQMSLLDAYGTGDANEIRLAKERMQLMRELDQDIVQIGAQNDFSSRPGQGDLFAAAPEGFSLDEGLGERGSVGESAPGVAGGKGTKRSRLKEMLELMGVSNATPQQAQRLMDFGDIKQSMQEDIDDAQDVSNAMEEMGENLAMHHADPLFDDAGEAWNKATAKSKEKRGIRWAKVRNDPWVLDRWMAVHNGVVNEMERSEDESMKDFRKRVSDMLVEARDSIAAQHSKSGGWLARKENADTKLLDLQTRIAETQFEETELLRELGAQIDQRATDREAYLAEPTAPGPAPTINYRRHIRELQPSELPERVTKRSRKTRAVPPSQPVVREQPEVERTAIAYKGSPFVAGSQRSYNPDVEVAEIFENPRRAAEEDTFAILVNTDVERFLNRVATMQAEDVQAARETLGAEPLDVKAERDNRLQVLKETSFSGAAGALEQGQKLTAPTLDHRVGAVKGVDAALANIAAGSNRIQYVELVTGRQLKRINGQLNRLKSVDNRVIGAEDVTIPTETASEAAVAPQQLRERGPYSFADHERQVTSGAFTRDPVRERQSLELAAQGVNTPEQQELIDQMMSVDVVMPRLSITQRPVNQPSTTETVGLEIERYVPLGRKKAVTVVESLSDIEDYLARYDISVSSQAGGFTHNGKVFLIAENIEQGTAGGVVMHEVGVHLSMKPDEINSLASEIRKMAQSGDKLARGALDSVDGAADTMAGYGATVTEFDENHEVVAYFVENAVNAGIDPTQLDKTAPKGVAKVLRQIMKLIQSALRALGLSNRDLTAQDIVDAAYGAADTVFRDPVSDPQVRMSVSNIGKDNRNYDKWLSKYPQARGYLTSMKFYTQRVGQTFLFSHQFADMAKNAMPAAADYFRLVAKRVTARGKFDADLQHHNNKAKEFSTKEYDQVNEYFIRSQKLQAWGFKPHRGAIEPGKIDRTLEAEFNAMTPAQQAFIKESFEMAGQLQQQREEVMRNEVEQSINEAAMKEPDPEKRQDIQLQGVADLAKFDREFRNRRVAWMPLRRHGEFASVFISDELRAAMDQDPMSQEVRDMKGDESHYVVEFHAKLSSADAAEGRMMEASTRPGTVRKFERQAMLNRHELIPFNFMNAMRSNLENSTAVDEQGSAKLVQAWTRLYIEQLGETSIRKSELERMDTAGFDRDMIKNFTQYGSAIGGTISGIQMGRETHDVLNRLRSDATQPGPNSLSNSAILNELLQRHAYMLDPNPTPMQDKVMGFVSLNMLLTSPAYFIVNSTQPFMLTMPVLAGNFGLDQTARRMTRNYRTIAKAWKAEHSFSPNKITKLLSGELADQAIIREEVGDDAADMMEELQQLGLFDIGIAADLGAIDNTKFRVTNALGKAHRGATHAVRTVEVFNRGVTALTAYQLAKANPSKIPVGSDGKRPSPRQYAINQVLETQGDYSGHNAPSIIKRLPFGKLMTQFRKFQLIQIGLLVRTMHQSIKGAGRYEQEMARRQLAYILGMHVVAGGALGLPMANLAALAYSMFGDEDEPDDLEVRLRQEIGDKGTADLLLKGLPSTWNVDVSAKVGMGQTFSVLPFTDLKLNRDSTLAAMGQLVFGAAGATAAQLSDAAGQLSQGNYGNAFAGAMPRGLRDVTRAVMYKNEGLRRRNPARDTAISAEEFTAFDIFMQGIGLPTTRTSGMQSRNRFYQNYKQLVGDRSSVIKGDYVQAFEANDADAMQAARNEWNDLQEARLRNGFKRQSAALLTRAVRDKRRREKNAVDGVFVDKSDRGFLDLLE